MLRLYAEAWSYSFCLLHEVVYNISLVLLYVLYLLISLVPQGTHGEYYVLCINLLWIIFIQSILKGLDLGVSLYLKRGMKVQMFFLHCVHILVMSLLIQWLELYLGMYKNSLVIYVGWYLTIFYGWHKFLWNQKLSSH